VFDPTEAGSSLAFGPMVSVYTAIAFADGAAAASEPHAVFRLAFNLARTRYCTT